MPSRHQAGPPSSIGGTSRRGAPEVGRVVGRYVLHDEIASGGMASVYFGRMTGAVGFSRTVAVKRLHPHLASDPDFVAMMLDEARLAARIVHPNVVQTLDVVTDGPPPGELFIVMEYVQGETLSRLQRTLWQRGERVPVATATTLLGGVLHGLHAAHEAKDERGAPLGIVHRDVSPQNVMVGADGSIRILDFGVAKAAGRMQSTREGSIKGKIPYMAPEQIRGGQVSRQSDIYAASVVLWEMLTGRRLFEADNEVILIHRITAADPQVDPPSRWNPHVSPELDALVLRGLTTLPERRFANAREMAHALERVAPLVPASRLGEWVEELAAETLAKRAARIASFEANAHHTAAAPAFAETLRLADAPAIPPERFTHDGDTHAGTALTTDARRKGARRTQLALALAALGVLSLCALGVLFWRAREVAAPTSAAESSAPASATMPVEPSASEEPSVAALASAAPAAPSVAVSPPTSAAPVSTGAPDPAPAKSKPGIRRGSCNPPYEVDANGIKTYKRECLK